jgi:cytochrome P450
MRGYIDRRRSEPRDDLISALIAAEEDGARLTTDEMITTCILLLNAGHEATVHTLGNAVKLALETGARPGADAARFVEEVLRYDPPLHLFTRWAYEDVEVHGHTFRRGDEVGLLLASAGRDEAVYAEAEPSCPTGRTGPRTSPSGRGCISASARRWRGWRCRSPCRSCLSGVPVCGWPRRRATPISTISTGWRRFGSALRGLCPPPSAPPAVFSEG